MVDRMNGVRRGAALAALAHEAAALARLHNRIGFNMTSQPTVAVIQWQSPQRMVQCR